MDFKVSRIWEQNAHGFLIVQNKIWSVNSNLKETAFYLNQRSFSFIDKLSQNFVYGDIKVLNKIPCQSNFTIGTDENYSGGNNIIFFCMLNILH